MALFLQNKEVTMTISIHLFPGHIPAGMKVEIVRRQGDVEQIFTHSAEENHVGQYWIYEGAELIIREVKDAKE